MQQLFIGVDVAKDRLDVHHPLHGATRIANTPAAAQSFAAPCAKQEAWIVFEASGGYDRVLREALEVHGVRFKQVRADITSLIAVLDRRIAKVEARMAALVDADPETQTIGRRLQTAPGVGPIVAATLIAEMPELGQLDRRRIAALAGLAPIARDSGTRIGPRNIGGGRPVVRTILYLAALQASRRSAVFRTFRERLALAGKPTKSALIATARKLLITLNAMLATGTDYDPAAVA